MAYTSAHWGFWMIFPIEETTRIIRGGGTLARIAEQYNEVSESAHMSERQHLPYIKLFQEIAKAYMWGCEYREKIRTLETF